MPVGRCTVRRFVQLMVLVAMILTGSVPGLHLLGPSRPLACCARMDPKSCPCRDTDRSPGPDAPCGPGLTIPAALLAVPGMPPQARPERREPAPFPRIRPAGMLARLRASSQGLRPRPGAAPPGASGDPQARLTVFRI